MMSNCCARLVTRDCDEFSERISVVAPGAPTVRPLRRAFEADALLLPFPRSSFFSLRISDAGISQPASNAFCGIAIPMGEPLRYRSGARWRSCSGSEAFVHRPEG